MDTPKNASVDTTSSMITIPFKDKQSADSACHPEQKKILLRKIRKPLLLAINGWFTNLNVKRATEIMFDHDIYTNASANKNTPQSAGTC